MLSKSKLVNSITLSLLKRVINSPFTEEDYEMLYERLNRQIARSDLHSGRFLAGDWCLLKRGHDPLRWVLMGYLIAKSERKS